MFDNITYQSVLCCVTCPSMMRNVKSLVVIERKVFCCHPHSDFLVRGPLSLGKGDVLLADSSQC